jgi:hypothetical protein
VLESALIPAAVNHRLQIDLSNLKQLGQCTAGLCPVLWNFATGSSVSG